MPSSSAFAHGVEDVVLRQRLLDEAERAEPAGLERRGRRAVRRDDHDRQRLVHAAQPAQHFEPVDARHLDVEEDEVRATRARRPSGLPGPDPASEDLVALVFENHPHRVADGRLVVDDEDAGLHGAGSGDDRR